MTRAPDAPLVLLPACRLDKEGQAYHTIGDKYVRAVAAAAGGLPLMLPSLADHYDIDAIVARADGIVLTGSPSNVRPEHYGSPADPKAEPHDTWRDAVTLPLIRAALAQACPLLAICRGMQELNVALGGTLHPRLHELAARMDHRRPDSDDIAVQYGPAHPVTLRPGGVLAGIVGRDTLTVNSLHWQGIETPAAALRVEATAEDGTVEAVSMPNAPGFVLGVQWHPEYAPAKNPGAEAIFGAFGAAARERAAGRG